MLSPNFSSWFHVIFHDFREWIMLELTITMRNTSLTNAGAAPVLPMLISSFHSSTFLKVSENYCYTKLTLLKFGSPRELHDSRTWLHHNAWNNCMVPRSCKVNKRGTRMPLKSNHLWHCGEPCKFTRGIVKL